jgi:uncharacterized membrane protein YecN with MAPEG domain
MSLDAPDIATRKRMIASSIWITAPGTVGVIVGAYALLPPLHGLEEASARLALAARWLIVAMLPYVGVCMTISGARFFEGAHDPTRGDESARLKVHCRVMQNTLEQLVWFAICVLAIAPMLSAAEVRLVPIVCVFFCFARLVYWWGYLRKGTLGRAPGVQLTFTLNLHLLGLAVLLLVLRSDVR